MKSHARFAIELLIGLQIYFLFLLNCVNIDKGKKQDELVHLLSVEPDFIESKTLLVKEMDKVGAKDLYGMKFHPEFMPIESSYR